MASSSPRPVWRALLATTARQTRMLMGAGTLFGIAGRLALVGAALTVAQGDAAAAGLSGAVAAVFFVVQRFALTAARVGAECDLYRAAARALVDSDVLEVPLQDMQRVVFESSYQGRGLLADTVPALAADLAVAVVAGPLLVAVLPVRVLLLAAIGLGVVLASLLAIRRITRRLQDRLVEATQHVSDAVLVAIEGRLEVVARGGDEDLTRALDGKLARYATVATRSSLGAALLGRLPLLLGAGVIAAVAVLDGATRAALGAAVLSQALLLASIMPVIFGLVIHVSEVVRMGPRLAPLVALLEAPRRPELASRGAPPPPLPATWTFEDVTFSYAAGAPAALENVTITWPPDRALVVVGANGGGKSTLLRLLLALRAPTRGVIRVGSSDLASLDVRALRRGIAYLPQRPYLGEAYLTVRDAMLLGRTDVTDADITKALARAGVLETLQARTGPPLEVRTGELSVGQRQRVSLARVLMQNTPMLVLDEPDANLDRAGVAMVAALVAELTASGKMVAVAAHTPELSAIASVQVELGRKAD